MAQVICQFPAVWEMVVEEILIGSRIRIQQGDVEQRFGRQGTVLLLADGI